MSIKIGYDPKSLGLLKWDYTNDDEKYVAVSNEGGITLYALKPKYFTPSGTSHLNEAFTNARDIDTSVYVGTITMTGYKTHSEFLTETVELCPVRLINNPFSGKNPYEYMQELKNMTAEEFATFYLNYGVTIEPFEIDIRDLPNIELNADTTVTVSVASDMTMTRPLQHLLDPSRGIDPVLTIAPGEQTATGFLYSGNFAGRDFSGKYDGNFMQTAVLNAYVQHMLQNKNREEAFENSQLFQNAFSLLSTLTDFNIVGGVGSALDAFLEHGLREEMFNDMRKQISNIGGDIVHNAIGQELDILVTITYPIKKKVYSVTDSNGFYIGDFEVNRPKTFDVHRRFPDMQTALNFINNNFKGNLIGGDITPIIDYGDYTEWFKRIINLGGLQ